MSFGYIMELSKPDSIFVLWAPSVDALGRTVPLPTTFETVRVRTTACSRSPVPKSARRAASGASSNRASATCSSASAECFARHPTLRPTSRVHGFCRHTSIHNASRGRLRECSGHRTRAGWHCACTRHAALPSPRALPPRHIRTRTRPADNRPRQNAASSPSARLAKYLTSAEAGGIV